MRPACTFLVAMVLGAASGACSSGEHEVAGAASSDRPPAGSRGVGTEAGASAPSPGDPAPPPAPVVRQTRALAAIVEFADTSLEAYGGPGYRSVAELRAQLDAMEDHWLWASLQVHAQRWDIVRARLEERMTADAFPDWHAFREAALRKALEQVDRAAYDANADGRADVVWLVVADGGAGMPYFLGGASGHPDGCVFQDSQDGLAARARATGTFNHEAGHCHGLLDVYGAHDTLHYLTFMSDPWSDPPNGLTAYERHLLGWFTPREITASTAGIELTPAETSFSAVRIPTRRDGEFFLIEYRARPGSGYGSSAAPHDGLAVYHVLEGAHQGADPPHVRLEPADGELAPGERPSASDFLSPESAPPRLAGRDYVTGEEVFRVDNVARTARGLRFDVTMSP